MTKFKKLLFRKLDNLDNRMTNVENKISDMKEKVNQIPEIQEQISDMKEKVNQIPGMQEQISDMKQKVDLIPGMQDTLVILESEVKTNFPALFEIYSLNYELQREDKSKIKSVQVLADNNSNRISHLEDISEDHSKQLSKLIS